MRVPVSQKASVRLQRGVDGTVGWAGSACWRAIPAEPVGAAQFPRDVNGEKALLLIVGWGALSLGVKYLGSPPASLHPTSTGELCLWLVRP